MPCHIVGVVAPDGEDILGAAHIAGFAPQGQVRAVDLVVKVRFVVGQVDAGAGAVVLAGAVYRRRVAEAADILLNGLRRENGFPVGHALEAGTDEIVGVGANHPFREIVGLDEKEPVVGVGGHSLVDDAEHMAGRHNVQGGQLADAFRVVFGQAVRHPRAPVVAAQEKGLKPQPGHGVNLILGHGALGVVGMVGVAGGLAAVAIAAQVGGHDGEIRGQPGGDLVPHRMGLRVAVQQQERRAAAAFDQVDGIGAGVHLQPFKALKHCHCHPPVVCSVVVRCVRRRRRCRARGGRRLSAAAIVARGYGGGVAGNNGFYGRQRGNLGTAA